MPSQVLILNLNAFSLAAVLDLGMQVTTTRCVRTLTRSGVLHIIHVIVGQRYDGYIIVLYYV